ncbi:xylulokinase [Spirochaetia bacterium]|nr:xylulokinase [Spirochaetia bacterium]
MIVLKAGIVKTYCMKSIDNNVHLDHNNSGDYMLMGIDLGTSSLKVMVADEQGTIAAQTAQTYQFDQPFPGYAEQNPAMWWEALKSALHEVFSTDTFSASSIRALSFSGQMHGAVLMDKNYSVLRPVILHCDARSSDQADTLKNQPYAALRYNPSYTGFLLNSLLWVREHEPGIFSRIRYVCLPKDYLKLKLSGTLNTDYSDASGTLAFDVAQVQWDKELLTFLGIDETIFPHCLPLTAPSGTVTKQAAVETGLAEGTAVITGGADQVMQAIGNGAIHPGQATVNIGSSGQVCFQSATALLNPTRSTNTFCAYNKNAWITMGATMTAGLALKWFAQSCSGLSYRDIDSQIEDVEPGSGGVVFIPYLNGERTPFMNPHLRAAFFGLNLRTATAHLARAVMEGVSFSLYDCIKVCENLGLKVHELIASGGGARSRVWLQIQADVYGLPLKTTQTEEQACTGALIAAGVGSGLFTSLEEACKIIVKYKEKQCIPDGTRHGIYRECYSVYKQYAMAIAGK